MGKFLAKFEEFLIYGIFFLAPLAVSSAFPNPFLTPKLAIVFFGAVLALLVKALRIIVEGKLVWKTGKFDLPVFVILLAYLISTVVKTPNKMEALVLPGTGTLFIASAVLYFLANQIENKKSIVLAFVFSGLALAVTSLLAAAGMFEKITQLPVFVRAITFNATGNFLDSALLLLVTLPLSVLVFTRTAAIEKRVFLAAASLIIVFGLLLSFFKVLPGKSTAVPMANFQTSWSVAFDTVKESPLLGTGPGDYLGAFSRLRPISYNQTSNWNIKFGGARSLYLTTITETGLLGAFGIILLFIAFYRTISSRPKNPEVWALGLLLALFFFFPGSPSLVVILFALLALSAQTKNLNINFISRDQSASRVPAFIVGISLIVLAIVLIWQAGRAGAAEIKFKQAIDSFNQNKAQETYLKAAQAINLNPRVDRYHAFAAQLTLALAQSTAQKKDITDKDKETISQLIQQAIAEAKATAALNRQRAGNWELLGSTYRSIMPFAQGADVFTIQAYSQAIALDPVNPLLRVSLGGTYYALGNYDSAIDAFKLAVIAKPDLANAHYNLAAAYREKGETQKAIDEIKTVLSLVPQDSNDYKVAQSELERLEEKKAASAEVPTDQGENLTAPETVEPALEPKLELPQGATP
ncbi:MAG: hypothetical protein UW85_C0013G0010 [Parcubacteria group bacterium GW2011_GWA1_Parcubacteria_45_10]|nr:MAG: hypothetical protein UW85_C0013G0010 [Parcubacteria group bacterium GW2011_GWA1_Parcubacteria_45_10]